MLIESGGATCALDKMYVDLFAGVELAYRSSCSTHVLLHLPNQIQTHPMLVCKWTLISLALPCFLSATILSAPRFAQSLVNNALIKLTNSNAELDEA